MNAAGSTRWARQSPHRTRRNINCRRMLPWSMLTGWITSWMPDWRATTSGLVR
ncbi:hypothetical protein [Petrimonas sulfuriphila]|uniref:hypothetical protein n=1 Tax=Petrimonas sulfuriphila TaxID=285070 RepID=UPI003EB7BC90